jgi:hypothetical protein
MKKWDFAMSCVTPFFIEGVIADPLSVLTQWQLCWDFVFSDNDIAAHQRDKRRTNTRNCCLIIDQAGMDIRTTSSRIRANEYI